MTEHNDYSGLPERSSSGAARMALLLGVGIAIAVGAVLAVAVGVI